MWFQHVIIAIAVLVCLAIVARQVVLTLRLRKGGLGSCCSKGCSAGDGASTTRSVFIPVESLAARK